MLLKLISNLCKWSLFEFFLRETMFNLKKVFEMQAWSIIGLQFVGFLRHSNRPRGIFHVLMLFLFSNVIILLEHKNNLKSNPFCDFVFITEWLQVIDPEDIDVYIGPYSSDSAISLARILTELQLPLISYAATSTTLQDTRLFPYFYRTVQADDKQVTSKPLLLKIFTSWQCWDGF